MRPVTYSVVRLVAKHRLKELVSTNIFGRREIKSVIRDSLCRTENVENQSK